MAEQDFNNYTPRGAYGTPKMIDLLPTMFGKVYTAPPEEAYFDMAENAVSFDTALANYSDAMTDMENAFAPQDQLFMSGDEVEAVDSDALDKAIYQISLEEQGGSDSLMTPHGPALDPNALDAMATTYSGLISELDPTTYEDDIAMADELLNIAGDEIDALVESVQHRVEKEGAMEDIDVFLRMAGDQINDALTSSGVVDIATRTIEDIGATVGNVATNIASMFDEGVESTRSFVEQAFPTDDIETAPYDEADIMATTVGHDPNIFPQEAPYSGIDIENFQPTQAGIGLPGLGIAGQAIGDLGRTIGSGIESGIDVDSQYFSTIAGIPETHRAMGRLGVPGGGELDPFEYQEEREELTSEMNELLTPNSSIEEIIHEIEYGIAAGMIDKSYLTDWVNLSTWDDMARKANVDPQRLRWEIERVIAPVGRTPSQPGFPTRSLAARPLAKTEAGEEMERKKAEDEGYSLWKVNQLQKEGYSRDAAIYILENGLAKETKSKPPEYYDESGLRLPDYSRSAIIMRRLLEGYTPSEAEAYYDDLNPDLKRLAQDPDYLRLYYEEKGELPPTETLGMEEFRKDYGSWITGKAKEMEKMATDDIYGKAQIVPGASPVHGVPDQDTLIIDPDTVKATVINTGMSINDYLKETSKSMTASFYNKIYSIPGMGKSQYSQYLPDIYARSKVIFYLTHGNQFLEGLTNAKSKVNEEEATLAYQDAVSLYDGFVNNYFKHYEGYHEPEFLNPHIELVGDVLRKLETDPKLTPKSKGGAWEQSELDALPWIKEYFVDNTQADTNRKWLVSLSINQGRGGRIERLMKKQVGMLMDHWSKLGWSTSEIYDQIFNLKSKEKQNTINPLSVGVDDVDPIVEVDPMVQEEDDLVGDVDEALALGEMYPGVSTQGLGSGELKGFALPQTQLTMRNIGG